MCEAYYCIMGCMKKYLFFLLLFASLGANAQLEYKFQHYSVNDGLSQNTVMSIMQDHKGFMWFGTWDGLSKFDGTQFTTYKSYPGDPSEITTNRIDFLYEDKFGFIWMQTYDGRFHRFDPRLETFRSLPDKIEAFSYSVQRDKYFLEANDGAIWIATKNEGLLCAISDPNDGSLEVVQYAPQTDRPLSHNKVNFLIKDLKGNVWVGTDCGLNAIDSLGQVEQFFPNAEKETNRFYAACPTEKSIWFGAEKGILWRYSYTTEQFERIFLGIETRVSDIEVVLQRYVVITTETAGFFVYDALSSSIRQFSKENNKDIHTNRFISVTQDSFGLLWLEADQPGIFRYQCMQSSLKLFTPKVDAAHASSIQPNLLIFEDINQRLWINPQGGGFSWYDRETDELRPFFNEPNTKDCRFSNLIHTAFADKDGNLWMCTYNKGLEKIVAIETQFQLYKVDKEQNTLTSNEVRSVQEMADGNIWIATKDGYTRCYDAQLQPMGVLCTDGSIQQNPQAIAFRQLVYAIFQDSKGRIWLGTKGAGLFLLTKNEATGAYSLTHFKHSDLNKSSLSNDNVYSIVESKQGEIWIGTFGGGLNKVVDNGGQIYFQHAQSGLEFYDLDKYSKIRCLLSDNEGILWVGTTAGLLQIEAEKAGRYEVYYSSKTLGVVSCLSDNNVHDIYQDKRGNIWIGTFGGGLNQLVKKATATEPAQFKAYTMKSSGAFNDIVLCILEDKFGNLWISSENAISRFDVENNTFQNFNVLSGASDSYFSEAAGVVFASDKLAFGSNKGLIVFDPIRILRSDDIPNIEFTRFQLFNQDVPVGVPGSPLKQSIGFTDKIVLNHNQSVFSIEYAALDMRTPDRIQYAFMLDGFEKEWNYVQSQRKATYTNLSKGTYQFRVKSTNKDGVWVNNDAMLTIVVKPSFWETPFAYILYILLMLALLFMVYYITMQFNHKNTEVEIERQVTDNKLRFFTNISHELRTPLSLILGPVENILHNEKISPSVREQLLVVQSNTERMMRMINQILDFRKIQNKKMRLKIQPTHIDTLVKNICANFNKEAQEKSINFTVQSTLNDTILWVDQDKIDIILYNLLSNAFKFTPDNRNITVKLDEDNEYVRLYVQDEGIGISKDKHNALFARFVSTSDTQKLGKFTIKGSGIGLNLVKELVDLHKGTIDVESAENKGTTFIVTFKKGKEHFDPQLVDFIVNDKMGSETASGEDLIDKHLAINLETTPKSQFTMLIVEDNQDMRNFLINLFKNNYKVLFAVDGKQGMEVALTNVPDLIISDLMMPEMDGLELTNALKSDEKTSHIPIILLTAKTAVESRLEALRFGADDYITKPFSPVYLEARVNNLLELRQKLQERYRNELLKLNPKKIEKDGVSPEEAFLAKLLDFMERNMDNNNLTVDDLVSEMALGRTVFFNKLKGLTGLSPVEFIREIRIKRAAQLLEDDRYNVTEVTYMVGMNDSRYFSKCFKAVFGMTPSEYKKNAKAKREA